MAGEKRRMKRLLNQVEKDPARVLEDPRCLKPHFCEDFFELCDDKALREPPMALDFASRAVQLAEKTGDRHLMNRAQGVLVHAHIANQKWDEAEQVLDDYRQPALACCGACLSEFFRRRGDLMVEMRRPMKALDDLTRAVTEHGENLSDDDLAKISFVRGIGYYYQRDPGRALDDAGKTLLELSLEAPRGYFLDGLAFVACFLQHSTERRHAEQADEYLRRFRERLKDVRDWTDVRVRLWWVEGGVAARLGDAKKAGKRFMGVRKALFVTGPVHHAVAVTVDEAMLIAREPDDRSVTSIRTLIAKCLRELDLDKEMRRRMNKIEDVMARKPEKAFQALDAFRRHFVVTVPGLV